MTNKQKKRNRYHAIVDKESGYIIYGSTDKQKVVEVYTDLIQGADSDCHNGSPVLLHGIPSIKRQASREYSRAKIIGICQG
jgi:hypothetical protein